MQVGFYYVNFTAGRRAENGTVDTGQNTQGQGDEQLIAQIAATVDRWGMKTPAILLLEAHRPFSFILSQVLLAAEPLLGLMLSPDRSRRFAMFLENGDNVELLLRRLESNR